MASVTALELVNRVLRRLRQQAVSSFADDKALVVLDLVNAAKEDVLTARNWSEDIRHDGVLRTNGYTDSTTTAFTNLSASSSVASLSGRVGGSIASPEYAGSLITRFVYNGDVTSANEASDLVGTIWRIKSWLSVGPTATMDALWTGPTTSTGKARYFVSEYLLPDTVREIDSITHEHGIELQLDLIDPGATFGQLYPDMAGRFGKPEIAGVGGYDTNTYNLLGTGDYAQSDPMLRLVLFPVPDDEYRLNYSYYYNHPELSETTDTLNGVKPEVVSSIIEKATADAVEVLEQRVNEGVVMSRKAEGRLREKHKSSGAQPTRRNIVGSWNGGSGRYSVRNGFPGVTITE